MKLPPVPTPPRVDLPPQLVIPLEAFASVSAIVIITLGFIYLLLGVKVFRVMTTLTGVLAGMWLGVFLGGFIESLIVGMLIGGAALGTATWFYTRWMIALPIGLAAAAVAWPIATLNGANPLAAFFISLASAVALGGPILLFYRTMMALLSCLQGAVFVVVGTSIGVLILRHRPLNTLQNALHPGGHLLLGAVCVLILALPAFYYQRIRYVAADGASDASGDSAASAPAPRKKAA